LNVPLFILYEGTMPTEKGFKGFHS